eukprot:gene25554-32024_t
MAVNEGTGGVLQLPESNITDEEIHALAALLRNNTSIEELNLRGNNITDDGARALGAVLAGRSGLRLVDLRGNKIAEALERSERVRHVYVHAGGKIEALGAQVVDDSSRWAAARNADGTNNNNNVDHTVGNVSTAHDDKIIALKESAWQGRSGGMDIDRNGESELLRESIRMRKKNLQRGELPPISDNTASVSPTVRSSSAPDFSGENSELQNWNNTSGVVPE